jgi:hypothetical protein
VPALTWTPAADYGDYFSESAYHPYLTGYVDVHSDVISDTTRYWLNAQGIAFLFWQCREIVLFSVTLGLLLSNRSPVDCIPDLK